ncbi:MAG: hypothetical protein PHR61_04940 [Candidatus Absconditabacteria bacterium]|nr:hypothetical protein [Candidatus Absconditabacteria bacterium]
MKLSIDQNNFLCVDHPEIPQVKQYTYQVAGYQFSDWDKGMIVLHKKDFKILNLKHFGDGMNLIYVKDVECGELNLKKDVVGQGYGLFSGFDEVSGEQKYFWPGARAHLDFVVPAKCRWNFSGLEDKLSLLYGLTLLYGKFEAKKGELMSIKIQIPLFGQYLKYQENFDQIILDLQKQGIFLKKDLVETNNGIVYQISSNDWELLEVFAKWYEAIEKFEKISKKFFTQDMKDKLIAFLLSDVNIPENGRQDVLDKIHSGVIKFLMKS